MEWKDWQRTFTSFFCSINSVWLLSRNDPVPTFRIFKYLAPLDKQSTIFIPLLKAQLNCRLVKRKIFNSFFNYFYFWNAKMQRLEEIFNNRFPFSVLYPMLLCYVLHHILHLPLKTVNKCHFWTSKINWRLGNSVNIFLIFV